MNSYMQYNIYLYIYMTLSHIYIYYIYNIYNIYLSLISKRVSTFIDPIYKGLKVVD